MKKKKQQIVNGILNLLIKISNLLCLIIIFYGCTLKSQNNENVKHAAYRKPLFQQDTAKILQEIDSLKILDFPKWVEKAYYVSRLTGVGVALTDPTDKKYQNSDSSNSIFKNNVIEAFEIYKRSNLFMKKIPIIQFFHFMYFDKSHLSKDQKFNLEEIMNNIADKKYCY